MTAYPMLRVDDLIDRLPISPLTKGYWQVPLDQEKTRLQLALVCFRPFGLQRVLATFQRMGLKDFSRAYIDMIVFSRMWGDHLGHLRTSLQQIQQAGLTVKRKKSRCLLGPRGWFWEGVPGSSQSRCCQEL